MNPALSYSAELRWPVLRRYDQAHLQCVALPLGGIGTGSVSLGGRGDLRDWEIVNRPAKGFAPRRSFFALCCRVGRQPPITRVLEGLIPPPYEGWDGAPLPNHGLPRFHNCQFEAGYPFGAVVLSDVDMPVQARLEAFNPLIPGDADASGIPVAVLRFTIRNKTAQAIDATVCGSLQNFIGTDGSKGQARQNVNVFRSTAGLRGIFMRSHGVARGAEQFGTLALTTANRGEVTYRLVWDPISAKSLADFWEDLDADGRLENQRGPQIESPVGSLAVRLRLPPKQSRAITFLLTWHFPNRQSWNPGRSSTIGNYYTTKYNNAWDVAIKTAAALPALEAQTVRFVQAFCESDLPEAVKEAALFNLSTLRTQTCFRTPDGRFFGWEGCGDHEGCCYGSCTHVWNYEQATAFLFGDLARTMRKTEFADATDKQGLMSFRVELPLSRARAHGKAAADGQMGCLMKLYRDWQLSGDDQMLQALWPKARRAMEFCWIPGGWDADRDGVMEGAQHNTLDVEYFGPNPLMGTWYLGALRAAEEMARHVGDVEFATTCRKLFEMGRRWIDTHLFNGEYYEHQVRPVPPGGRIAKGLLLEGKNDPANPDFQLGRGCLVDQLAGQYMAHTCGLGYLLDPSHVRQTLRSLLRYNYRPHLHGHFNQQRTYALNDEAALLMITYPQGGRRRFPLHATEVMTGFEYCAAVHMLYEGLNREGLKCITAIRQRYDGSRRNPFNEAECGHHYARAMASWAAVLALTGFHYSAVSQSLRFQATARASCFFWSNGSAWGTFRQRPKGRVIELELRVAHGDLHLRQLILGDLGSVQFASTKTITAGRPLRCRLPATRFHA